MIAVARQYQRGFGICLVADGGEKQICEESGRPLRYETMAQAEEHAAELNRAISFRAERAES